MKVRKTLIFPLEHQSHDDLTRQALLYRAANWLESTMRALQEQRENDNGQEDQTGSLQALSEPSPGHFPFRRYLMKTRFFMATRGRLPLCSSLKRPGPHHW